MNSSSYTSPLPDSYLRIQHTTEYVFAKPTTLLEHRLLLRPRESYSLRISTAELRVEPVPTIRWHRDALDNSVGLLTFSEPARRLSIASDITLELHEVKPFDFIVEPEAVTYPFLYRNEDAFLMSPFIQPSWPLDSATVRGWLESISVMDGPIDSVDLLIRINAAIHASLRYEVREEPGVQSPSTTLARGSGSCRDFAALFMEGCRRLGLASRFVSGYLNPGATALAPRPGSTHAWAEVYLPGAGWKGFDPTGASIVGMDHIPTAVAQHPERVPPVSGGYFGTPDEAPEMQITVQVEPVVGWSE